MAVLLSPVGGVAAQFFTNNGVPLSGGKIFTYAAGTSTPQATYTTATGLIQHSNPIILDAAGRVPTGEIWLTDGFSYKFVLKDANDVLIATYDNIVGINSNFVNFVNQQEIQTATAGQTVFTLTTMEYQPGTGNLSVFVDGVNQYGPGAQYAFVETDSNTVTFEAGLHVGALVKFTSTQIQNSGVADASQITYTAPYVNAVTYNVEEKLAQTVSVKDFGAVGDGVTDDTTSIQNAFSALSATTNGAGILYFPKGTYLTTGLSFNCTNLAVEFVGEGWDCSIIKKTGTSIDAVFETYSNTPNANKRIIVSGFQIDANNVANCDALLLNEAVFALVKNCYILNARNGIFAKSTLLSSIEDSYIVNSYYGVLFQKSTSGSWCNENTIRNCSIDGNEKYGVYFEQGSALHIENCDFEQNGVAGDSTTGAVIIKDTIDDEAGFGQAFIRNCWFESNQGWGIYVEGAANGLVAIEDTQVTAPTVGGSAGQAIYAASGLRRLSLQNVASLSSGNTVEVHAENLFAANCYFNIFTNSATNYSLFQVKTAALDSVNSIKTTTSGSNINVGTNLVTAKNNPKVLCSFDGSATTPITPGFSYNVTDITKNGTGDYTVNITTPVTLGPVNITALDVGGNSAAVRYVSSSTTTYRFICTNLSGTAVDPDTIGFVAYGTF